MKPTARSEPRLVPAPREIPPAWLAFVRYCQEMGYGKIERLEIQDGLPVLAEVTTKKIKFR